MQLERRFSNAKTLINNDEKPQRHKGHFGFAVTERSRSAVEPQSFLLSNL
jgi:hypothetical protein